MNLTNLSYDDLVDARFPDDIEAIKNVKLQLAARRGIIEMRDQLFRKYLQIGYVFAVSDLPGAERLKAAMAEVWQEYGTTCPIGVEKLLNMLEPHCPRGYKRLNTRSNNRV